MFAKTAVGKIGLQEQAVLDEYHKARVDPYLKGTKKADKIRVANPDLEKHFDRIDSELIG